MKAVFFKELGAYFSSFTAYIIGCFFLLTAGSILFVFANNFNVLDLGFADLQAFFALSPWLLLFIIPAMTMRSFAHEHATGTLEMLWTSPVSNTGIVLGKFAAAMVLILLTLIPTLIYVFTIAYLGEEPFNADFGAMTTSYFGLVLLAFCFASIGVCCSVITKNQIAAVLLSTVVCLFFYEGFSAIGGALQ